MKITYALVKPRYLVIFSTYTDVDHSSTFNDNGNDHPLFRVITAYSLLFCLSPASNLKMNFTNRQETVLGHTLFLKQTMCPRLHANAVMKLNVSVAISAE